MSDKVDLGALEALIAVDRTGTVGAAAAELGYTPSAVSQRLKRLEKQVGVALLERVGRGVVLTAQGRRLADDGRDLLLVVERVTARAAGGDDGLTPVGRVRLVAFSTAVRGIVAPLARAVRADAPGLDVVVTEHDPWDAVARVAAGQADIGIVHAWRGIGLQVPHHVRYEEIGEDSAELLVPADHPLAGRDRVTPGDLLDEVWASTFEDSICYAWFVRMFGSQPRQPRIAYWASEFASHVELVRAGAAVSLVPRLGRGVLPDGVVAVPVADPVPVRQIGVVWRASMAESPAVTFLRDRIRAAFAE